MDDVDGRYTVADCLVRPEFHTTHINQSPINPYIYTLSCSCSYKTLYSFSHHLSVDNNFHLMNTVLNDHWREEFMVRYWEWLSGKRLVDA